MSKIAMVDGLPGSRPMPTLPQQELLMRLQQLNERLSMLPSTSELANLQQYLGALAPAMAAQVTATLGPLRESLPSRGGLEEVLELQRAALTDLASELGRKSMLAIDERLAPFGETRQSLEALARSSAASLSKLNEVAARLAKIAAQMAARDRDLKREESRLSDPWAMACAWLLRTATWVLLLGGMAWMVGTNVMGQQAPDESAAKALQRQAQVAAEYELLWSRATPTEREAMRSIVARPAK